MKEFDHIGVSLQGYWLDVSVVNISSSSVALNPNSFPGTNDDLSSSAVCIVLILLPFTVRFSCRINRSKKFIGKFSSVTE